MKLYKMYIGLNDKDTKKQIIPTDKAVDKVNGFLNGIKQDCTLYIGNGLYTHENGERVNEKTLILEFMFIDYERIIEIARALKEMLNQEAIALQVLEIDGAML